MKKLLSIILSISLLFAITACGNKTVEETTNSTVSTTEKGVEENSEEVATKAEPVAVGNTITLDFAEITVDTAEIADDIQQSIKTGSMTRISGPDRSDDKEFVYIRGTIKNTSKAEISSPEISGTVDVDGYTFDIESVNIIESDGSSAYSLAPLMSYTYTLYAEIPNELAESFTQCKVDFGFEENFAYPTTYSDKEYVPAYLYTLSITK